jgi:hypothetical protein
MNDSRSSWLSLGDVGNEAEDVPGLDGSKGDGHEDDEEGVDRVGEIGDPARTDVEDESDDPERHGLRERIEGIGVDKRLLSLEQRSVERFWEARPER